ncbi:MAG: hypothetical protein R2774_03490 [Saprospiraceae bacterium]
MNVKNILPVFVLAILTIIVPLGSWYYLNSGLQYQKAAFKQLIPKDSLFVIADSNSVLKGKITVIAGSATDRSLNTKLANQFDKVDLFQLVEKDSVLRLLAENNPIYTKISVFPEDNYVLLDTSLRVRNLYPSDSESVKSLVAHIALILPRKKDADIKMK